MEYELAYTEAALACLENVPKKHRRQIVGKIERLKHHPIPQGVKPLKGVDYQGQPVYRERSGDYRILYVHTRTPAKLLILDIGDRKDIYRNL